MQGLTPNRVFSFSTVVNVIIDPVLEVSVCVDDDDEDDDDDDDEDVDDEVEGTDI